MNVGLRLIAGAMTLSLSLAVAAEHTPSSPKGNNRSLAPKDVYKEIAIFIREAGGKRFDSDKLTTFKQKFQGLDGKVTEIDIDETKNKAITDFIDQAEKFRAGLINTCSADDRKTSADANIKLMDSCLKGEGIDNDGVFLRQLKDERKTLFARSLGLCVERMMTVLDKRKEKSPGVEKGDKAFRASLEGFAKVFWDKFDRSKFSSAPTQPDWLVELDSQAKKAQDFTDGVCSLSETIRPTAPERRVEDTTATDSKDGDDKNNVEKAEDEDPAKDEKPKADVGKEGTSLPGQNAAGGQGAPQTGPGAGQGGLNNAIGGAPFLGQADGGVGQGFDPSALLASLLGNGLLDDQNREAFASPGGNSRGGNTGASKNFSPSLGMPGGGQPAQPPTSPEMPLPPEKNPPFDPSMFGMGQNPPPGLMLPADALYPKAPTNPVAATDPLKEAALIEQQAKSAAELAVGNAAMNWRNQMAMQQQQALPGERRNADKLLAAGRGGAAGAFSGSTARRTGLLSARTGRRLPRFRNPSAVQYFNGSGTNFNLVNAKGQSAKMPVNIRR